jgi:hypothetical protein
MAKFKVLYDRTQVITFEVEATNADKAIKIADELLRAEINRLDQHITHTTDPKFSDVYQVK